MKVLTRYFLMVGAMALISLAGSFASAQSPAETVYERVTLVGTAVSGYQDGPGAEAMLFSGICDADNADNVYWMERAGYAVLRKYDPKTKRVHTVGGSSWGYLDGPLEVARFTSANYMACDFVRVSLNGRWLYVADPGNGGILRLVDLHEKMVSTIDPEKVKGVTAFDVDSKGTCYATSSSTVWKITPDGKVEKLNVEGRGRGGTSTKANDVSLDEKNEVLYAMVREGPHRFWCWDLKTGKHKVLFNPGPGEWHRAPLRALSETGPAEGTSVRCPYGVSIKPGEEGKTFYWGGGDDTTFYRFDLVRRWSDAMKPIGDDRFIFGESKRMNKPAVCTWARAPQWDERGNAYTFWSIWPKVIVFRPVGEEARP